MTTTDGAEMTQDVNTVLVRAARRNGWTEETSNSLDYYTHKFTRPEPGDRKSVVRVRVTNRIVDVQVDIGGLRQSFTIPSLQRIESILASAPPEQVRDLCPEECAKVLNSAVWSWRVKYPSDFADAVRGGDHLANAAESLLRNMKGDNR